MAIALSIAGSDPSGGAGIQADLKSFSANGAYGMCVITALTAQNTQGVQGIHPVPIDFVARQLDTVLADITPDATKIGMLASTELVNLVSTYVESLQHVVFDPVMVATSGDRLLDEDAIAAVRELIKKVDLITPNVFEAAVLLDCDVAKTVAELEEQGRALLDLGAKRVLVKGGHLDADATDIVLADGEVATLTSKRIDTVNTHGTGCTLSSAIAALRPQRADWVSAIRDAKTYLTGAIAAADKLGVGHGRGPVHHFERIWA